MLTISFAVTGGILALAIASASAQTGPITGAISFSGGVTPYISANGTGALATSYSQAHSLVFRSVVVSVHSSGSFAAITNGTMVVMASPLLINPEVAPAGPLWTAGKFSFHATSISTLSFGGLFMLRGVGVFSNGTPGDSTLGTWTAGFMEISYTGNSMVTDPAPSLKIATDGTNAILSWPTNSISLAFSVQATTNLAAAPNWETATNAAVLINNQMTVNWPLSNSGQMFRLAR